MRSSGFQVDHVFVAVGSGAAEMDVLRAAGFRTGVAARAGADEGVSRLGLALRSATDLGAAPLETWSYRPPYIPGGVSIPVARNSIVPGEPLPFFMPRRARAVAEPGAGGGRRIPKTRRTT